MATRGVAVTITYVAWDTSANSGKTGDVSNHTLRWVKDGTASAPTNAASEVDATNCPGLYKITTTATESDCNIGALGGKSSTANVSIIPVLVQFERLPDAAPDAAGGVRDVARVAGTAQTARDLGANIDATVSSRLAAASYTAPLDAAGTRSAIGLATANLDTQLDAIPTAAENTAAILTTAITEAYRANGGAPTLAQFMCEVLAHLGEAAISGTTKTIKKLDHVTSAATFTLDSATDPATITRAT